MLGSLLYSLYVVTYSTVVSMKEVAVYGYGRVQIRVDDSTRYLQPFSTVTSDGIVWVVFQAV